MKIANTDEYGQLFSRVLQKSLGREMFAGTYCMLKRDFLLNTGEIISCRMLMDMMQEKEGRISKALEERRGN